MGIVGVEEGLRTKEIDQGDPLAYNLGPIGGLRGQRDQSATQENISIAERQTRLIRSMTNGEP